MGASAFLFVQLQRPGPRVISQPNCLVQCLALRDISRSGCVAENMPLRQLILYLSELNRHFYFSCCVAKYATLSVCLMPIGGPQDAGQLTAATGSRVLRLASATGASAFLFVQTPAASSLGHKPTQLRGKKRHFAGPSYARQSWTAASAFLHQISFR